MQRIKYKKYNNSALAICITEASQFWCTFYLTVSTRIFKTIRVLSGYDTIGISTDRERSVENISKLLCPKLQFILADFPINYFFPHTPEHLSRHSTCISLEAFWLESVVILVDSTKMLGQNIVRNFRNGLFFNMRRCSKYIAMLHHDSMFRFHLTQNTVSVR